MSADQDGAVAGNITLDEVIEVIEEIGERWDCREITGGVVAVPREGGPGGSIPRAETTPARLLALVRRMESRP